ncbi:MAG TPA: hypothetical protein VK208_20140 [Pyrinomonadaceae bacterium]|nr:hypothetical protein [Pyrinomonadaceae bacterium]
MTLKYSKNVTAIALLLTLAVGHFFAGVTFAAPVSSPGMDSLPQQVMGVLTTSNNRAIVVNGANATSGATIPSGASIETPADVGATIRIAGLGSLCIAANTKLIVEFDRQGNVGSIRVNITEGCAILRTLKDTSGVVNTAQGNLGQINPATGGTIDFCLRPGAAPSVNQGSAVDAGAGASALDCGAAGAAAAPLPGIPTEVAVAFIGGGAAGLYLLFRGGNPSPSGL